jgi:serine/threonine protein phosphatase PrpC
MGGHQHGECSQQLGCTLAGNSYCQQAVYTAKPKPSTPDETLQEIMQNGVQDAHRAIMKQVPGSGTTLTAALILGIKRPSLM